MNHRIGIFGDSYATEYPLYQYMGKYIGKPYVGKSWITYFRELNPEATIDTYGLPGSCLYYSYAKFFEHKDDYDQIIFVFTDASRMSKIIDHYTVSCVDITHAVRGMKQHERYTDVHNFYSAMKEYYLYIQDEKKDKEMWKLMYNEITKQSKVFSINAFNSPNALSHIQRKEVRFIDDKLLYEKGFVNGIVDLRANHLTDESNEILASEIHNQITNGISKFELDLEKYKFNSEISRLYFVPKSLIKK